jgi:hypothetical protein
MNQHTYARRASELLKASGIAETHRDKRGNPSISLADEINLPAGLMISSYDRSENTGVVICKPNTPMGIPRA